MILKKIFSFVSGLVLILICANFFLKFTEIVTPFKTLSPTIGKTFLKNKDIHVHKEGLYIGKTNKDGFIGIDYSFKKADTIFRIALLGDSFTEGFQLKENLHFSKILEKKLNSLSNRKHVEVLNFGVSSSTLLESYIREERLASKFSIDLYLFFVDSYDFIIMPQNILNSLTYSVQNNKIITKPNQTKTYSFYKKNQYIIDNSPLFNFFLNAFFIIHRKKYKEVILGKFYKNNENSINESKKYYDPYFKNLPTFTKTLISNLSDKKNTLFVFNDDININLKNNLDSYHLNILTLSKPFDSLKQLNIDPFYWELPKIKGHLNKVGNKVTGDYIYKKIKDNIPLR